MEVLGIRVAPELSERWREWLAPTTQPFFVERRGSWPHSAAGAEFSGELRDTFAVWRVAHSLEVIWLDEDAFLAMPRARRATLIRLQVRCGRGAVPTVRGWQDLVHVETLRTQADGHRFLWWPSLLATGAETILSRVVVKSPDGRAPDGLRSLHDAIESRVWRKCAALLPKAREIAGTFAASSGSNCFGNVMAATGVGGAADVCMLEETFLEWLGTKCRPGGDDHDAGTVLVWRETSGRPVHAAVTIGDGWALEKPSGEWWTPRIVARVDDVIRTKRAPGQRLERHHVRG